MEAEAEGEDAFNVVEPAAAEGEIDQDPKGILTPSTRSTLEIPPDLSLMQSGMGSRQTAELM